MQNKTLILSVIVALAAGLLIGWLAWGNQTSEEPTMTHQMPNGHTMNNAPMDMDTMMATMTAELAGKTGDAFDQEFLSEMIVHHEGAVAMAKLVLEKSERPELIKLANDIISAQTSEIAMMKQWQKAWSNR